MEYHRISFIHNDTEYSFVKAMSSSLTGYALVTSALQAVTKAYPVKLELIALTNEYSVSL